MEEDDLLELWNTKGSHKARLSEAVQCSVGLFYARPCYGIIEFVFNGILRAGKMGSEIYGTANLP